MAERKLKLKRIREYLSLEFQMNESAHFIVTSEARSKSPIDNNSLEAQINSNSINCTQAIKSTSFNNKKLSSAGE